MTYDAVKPLKLSEFKRLCGVQPKIFEAMLSVSRQVELNKPLGRPSKLSMEDQLLMTFGSTGKRKLAKPKLDFCLSL